MNLANKITMLRIILTFVFALLFLPALDKIWWTKLLALVIFIFAAVSDFLDGFIAKRRNMVTDFGRFMDPIADKILVLTAFAAFVQLQLIDAWMFMIIVSREILITSLRLFALNKGKVLSAARAGKHKTVLQMLVIFTILGFILLKEVVLKYFTWNPAWESVFRQGIFYLMLLTVALTLYSGLSYLWDNRKIITRL
ncbi:MAG: CDP-diacylglycerol--glycerol-3-phosphate 3-phosphatidyltransferase [Candidatus Omnitrophica bacterium CG11_big_fil_rev_8_21_14_0_20_41_12]|nr:MAG: CDP-diacylglycerol--glycerol-3-phosphate 3-phosphatidyltransferase [Candidatus Omnitrophica bacterium CG11_big_fil_rev_8_21_14_0_20_41_12]